ncbi:MAG: DUF5131 family protein, partial [Anaerofustis stercorihominis]|nr:DUF5131 family protein [Anaerofustis stercorihominis]
KNCYVYRTDAKYEKDSSEITKNTSFYDPVKKKRDGSYKLPSGEIIYTCFTSDFFLEYADEWRKEAWEMIRQRSDARFLFITKRIHRFNECIPDDWGDGYENVIIGCTVENQKMADFRLPIFADAPIKHKMIICEPLLENIDISRYLTPQINLVNAGGESGTNARICDYEWILSIRQQCIDAGVPFEFHQTGTHFKKDGKLYTIPRKLHHSQAKKANIDTFNYEYYY